MTESAGMNQGLRFREVSWTRFRGLEDVKKSILKFAMNSAFKKSLPGCRISDRWYVGKHLGSKIKLRKLKESNFFTSSRRN